MMGTGNNWRGRRKGTDSSWGPGGPGGDLSSHSGSVTAKQLARSSVPVVSSPSWISDRPHWAGQSSVFTYAPSPGASIDRPFPDGKPGDDR